MIPDDSECWMSSVMVGGADAGLTAAHAAALLNSSKYRSYVAAVDKALKAFEATNEWADLISALGKLSRVFHSNARFGDIPKPVTVAKRLSQCLHPALPHGVHLKALETYRQLFDILGQKHLPRLLYLFAVGLFPLMDHCGIKVKSELLGIFEQYLLPLGANLKPALPGFITGVLLGLEEGTEFYDRSFALLDQVQEGVGAESFFACLWEAVLGSPSVRLPALIYVNAKFDRRKTMDDQLFIMGDHVDHMIAALCAVADDEGSTLVQRHLLDFLCTAFPLNSDHLVQGDFVQLLRRCLFVVLRRDMSLNRRLYQWLLNRSGDAAVSGLPVGGSDEHLDTSFFKAYALPLIRSAIEEYLRLDTVEVVSASAAWDGTKEHQVQFTEVRVCRLLLYFLDRQDLGALILEESLAMLLHYSSGYARQCSAMLSEDVEYADAVTASSSSSSSQACVLGELSRRGSTLSRASNVSKRSHSSAASPQNKSASDLIRRVDEIRKTLNLLLNSLDVGFVWNFLERRFQMLMESEEAEQQNGAMEADMPTTESSISRQQARLRKAEELQQFPSMALFCVHTVELDTHGDIRGKYLPQLLRAVLSGMGRQGVNNMKSQIVLGLIELAHCILLEINQSAAAVEAGMATAQQESSDRNGEEDAAIIQHRATILESGLAEQRLIEECLEDCGWVLAQVCDWYCSQRCTERLEVFTAISALQREFADFPLYSFANTPVATRRKRSSGGYSEWLRGLLNVVSLEMWDRTTGSVRQSSPTKKLDDSCILRCSGDFLARADAVDLITYVYVRSASVAEQHFALQGRKRRSFEVATNEAAAHSVTKGTTTVLLKPLLSGVELRRMETDGVFLKAAHIVWACLGDMTQASCHEIAARLLTLLHSRKVTEPSSDIEDLIVAHLTSSSKVVSGAAARKFRALWMLNRRGAGEDIYPGVPSKPFNRVVMILLGILADDAVGCENIELKNLVAAWFVDCAKHNDLPKILQMVATILLNPTTARISIQYLTIHNQITKEQVASMPAGLCAVTLLCEGGGHSLHHLCEDPSLSCKSPDRKRSPQATAILERFRSGQDLPAWCIELRNRLLQAGDSDSCLDLSVSAGRSHKKTLSDIPIFDEDNESVGTASLDSVDQTVSDVMEYMLDRVCHQSKELYRVDSADEHTPHTANSISPQNGSTPLAVDSTSEVCVTSGPSTNIPQFESAMTDIENKTLPAVVTEYSVSQSDSIKRVKSGHRRQDSLQESIFTMTAQELRLFDASELPRLKNGDGDDAHPLCHELHAHMLLYVESGRAVDLGRAERLLRILIALMRSQRGCMASRMIVSCMISSGTASLPKSTSNGGSNHMLELLSRHVRAILGHEFWSSGDAEGNSSSTDTVKSKHHTFLELFMTVSLYFLRSYFLNSPITPVSNTDLRAAWKCKMAALDFLSELVRELISMIRESESRALVAYVHGILQRSKLQKCLLHLLLTSVHNVKENSDDILPLSVDILEFNDGPTTCAEQFGDLLYGYQSCLLDLTALVIQLEMDVKNGFQNFTDQNGSGMCVDKLSINHQIYNSPQHRSTLREPHIGMVELRMFLLTVLNALKKNTSRHELWHFFIVQILPFLDRSLPTFCIHVSEQLCKNVESAVNVAYRPNDDACDGDVLSMMGRCSDLNSSQKYPPNYAIGVLETLTTLMHFCLIDSSAQIASAIANVHQPSQTNTASASSMMSAIPGTKGATELFSNLVKVFSFSEAAQVSSSTTLSKFSERSGAGSWKQARMEMLNSFPHALATICDVWTVMRKRKEPLLPVGSAQQIKRLLLDLLSPIAQHHQQSFLSALAVVWLTRGSIASRRQIVARIDSDRPSFDYSEAQLDIANLLLSIKVLPFENLISTVAETLKECAGKSAKPGTPTDKQSTFPTEVSLLEMLHGCVKATPSESLHSCWTPLQVLFTESPVISLPPKATFILFKILADFVHFSGAPSIIEDKQISRAVQDACQKLTEAINTIVGWQLEQTTWLKRTLVVKHDSGQKSQEASPLVEFATAPSSLATSETNSLRGSTTSLVQSRLSAFEPSSQLPSSTTSSSTLTASTDKKSSSNLRTAVKETGTSKRDPTYSTQALFLLAENLAELVDSICKSEDKDRLLPTLHAVWNNTLPYLKAKNARNARFFLASSQLLASMSTFNYMRPVWRKATLDLLLDPAFFKMDVNSLKQWLTVIDHLMTHDKTSFKELLARISTTQNSALSSLITSKEAEYEMRAQALKRLAFIVLSSELDQYQSQLPDIQERLSDNLRLSQVPNLHAQVFLCYRVLLLRLKPNHLVSMWPSMVTELVHVLLQIEQQLTGTANVSDDLKCDRNDQWMQLYLAACKLLETLCTLPSGYLAQFQMCHWAFVTSVAASNTDSFVPFAERIYQLLCSKYGRLTTNERKLMSASLVSVKTLTSFSELRPFFRTLATQNKSLSVSGILNDKEDLLRDACYMNGSLSYKSAITRLEHALYVDFAEHWQL
uniref:Protein pad-1 n=2 Tax=Ascaris TaxID=6251 RepID=F1KPR7_ASCSU